MPPEAVSSHEQLVDISCSCLSLLSALSPPLSRLLAGDALLGNQIVHFNALQTFQISQSLRLVDRWILFSFYVPVTSIRFLYMYFILLSDPDRWEPLHAGNFSAPSLEGEGDVPSYGTLLAIANVCLR